MPQRVKIHSRKRVFDGFFKLIIVAGKWCALVKAHFYVCAKPILNVRGYFRIQIYWGTVYMAGKFNTIVVDFGQRL